MGGSASTFHNYATPRLQHVARRTASPPRPTEELVEQQIEVYVGFADKSVEVWDAQWVVNISTAITAITMAGAVPLPQFMCMRLLMLGLSSNSAHFATTGRRASQSYSHSMAWGGWS